MIRPAVPNFVKGHLVAMGTVTLSVPPDRHRSKSLASVASPPSTGATDRNSRLAAHLRIVANLGVQIFGYLFAPLLNEARQGADL